MRVNIEDKDFDDEMHSLDRLAYLVSQSPPETIDYRKLMLGYLAELWHGAISNGTKIVTLEQAMAYMRSYSLAAAKLLLEKMCETGFLEALSDGNFRILRKEKDFEAKNKLSEMGRKGGLAKAATRKRSYSLAAAKLQLSYSLANYRSKRSPEERATDKSSALSSGLVDEKTTSHDILGQQVAKEDAPISRKKRPSLRSKTAPATLPLTASAGEAVEPKDQKPTQLIRQRFEANYREAMNLTDAGQNVPGWGMEENRQAKRLLSSESLPRILEMLDYYFFEWKNPALLDEGFSFCRGSPRASFFHNTNKMLSHKLDPRRAHKGEVMRKIQQIRAHVEAVDIDRQVTEEEWAKSLEEESTHGKRE